MYYLMSYKVLNWKWIPIVVSVKSKITIPFLTSTNRVVPFISLFTIYPWTPSLPDHLDRVTGGLLTLFRGGTGNLLFPLKYGLEDRNKHPTPCSTVIHRVYEVLLSQKKENPQTFHTQSFCDKTFVLTVSRKPESWFRLAMHVNLK